MIKRTTLLMLIVFLAGNFCFCQENGVVTYTVTHNWVKKITACEYLSKAYRDRYAYTWSGDNEWETKAELKFNVWESRYEKKPDDEHTWSRGEDYFIYRNRETNEMLDIMTVLSKDYALQDSIVCQNWKIKNDMKEVAGRICMNASYFDTIRGKEVIAWFALDLPVSAGPDRYCGLPGMILEVNEANGAVVYTATHILFSDERIEIQKPDVKKKRKIIDNQEFKRIEAKYIGECKKMERPYFWGGFPF
ncbi:MAG: GLPGLI family protein [Lentimicrobiaceae bacterium]|nr:GLPGLI family protein [Lentimicrobiaceae bacterium]